MANRALVYTIYPNEKQNIQCQKTFGCCLIHQFSCRIIIRCQHCKLLAGSLCLCKSSYCFFHGLLLHIQYSLNCLTVNGWMNIRIVVHVVSGILLIAVIDYIVQLLKVFKVDVASKREAVIEKYRSFKARWY